MVASTDWRAQGKKNKIAGAKFEKKIRDDFIGEGWMVDKWSCNVDLDSEEIVPTKHHYIPGRGSTLGHGFPDFIVFRVREYTAQGPLYEIMFVECKMNGKLKKEEKEKCRVMQIHGYIVKIAYVDESQDNRIRLREFKYTEKRESIPRG